VFRRRRKGEPDELDDAVLDDETEDGADDAADPQADEAFAVNAAPARPQGPWDHSDAPDDGLPRVDLGAVQVPLSDGMELRLDVQDDVIVSATIVDGHSMLQIHAFAAPKRSGIWDEVREEIATSLRTSGGSAEEVDGPFGRELRARIPVPDAAQGQHLQPARFIGVDGPRWFLRGLITGAASTDPNQAAALESAFRDVVVVRGGDAMAPRELIPLRLPREAMQQVEAQRAEQQKPTLEMLDRGPEITETR